MTTLTIEALGLTKEEAAERVIAQIAKDLCFEPGEDEDGYVSSYETQFAKGIEAVIRARIDAEVTRVADEVFAPRVNDMVENVTLQATNSWGEPKGQKLTFREYLIQRAEAYMTEQVDYQGKPKDPSSYNWTARSTRIAHMVHQHLHYHIEAAMKEALAQVNSSVAKGLHEATRLAINEVTGKLKVEVKS